MKKALLVILALGLLVSVSYAGEGKVNATTPPGAIVETGKFFAGKIIDAVKDATGQKKVTVQSETGEKKVFIVDDTIQVMDTGFNALTFNQLKKGEKVTVKSSK